MNIVEKYDMTSGTLSLVHDYPKTVDRPVLALVNIDHVLESVESTDLEVGAWVNVVAYVTDAEEDTTLIRPRKSSRRKRRAVGVRVQAIMLGSAGMLNVVTYEKALEDRKLAAAF